MKRHYIVTQIAQPIPVKTRSEPQIAELLHTNCFRQAGGRGLAFCRNSDQIILAGKPSVVHQAADRLRADFQLLSQLLNGLWPAAVDIVPDVGAELFLFVDGHSA